jgi:hypothetical protein
MPKMRITYYLAFAAISLSPSAFSATWNNMAVGFNKSLYFFDADTVEKNANSVTLWIKTVQISAPDTQGAWATAVRLRINCTAKTFQTLAASDYDNEGNFIKASNKSESPAIAAPDTTGESIIKIACESNFPRDTSEKYYYKVEGNDIFKFRDDYLRYLNAKVDTAPK